MSLFTNPVSEHLTASPIDYSASYPGMAHFAGTGPKQTTCRECIFWAHDQYDYAAKGGKLRGLIKPARCKRYQQLTGQQGAKIPDDAMSCRHFERVDLVPERFAKS